MSSQEISLESISKNIDDLKSVIDIKNKIIACLNNEYVRKLFSNAYENTSYISTQFGTYFVGTIDFSEENINIENEVKKALIDVYDVVGLSF